MWLIATMLYGHMATRVYRCPTTGQGDVYETVRCAACTRAHLVNRSTDRVLGEDR